MRILKRGINRSDLWIGQCHHCKIVIEISSTELFAGGKKLYKGEKDANFEETGYPKCPNCYKTFPVHRSDSEQAQEFLNINCKDYI